MGGVAETKLPTLPDSIKLNANCNSLEEHIPKDSCRNNNGNFVVSSVLSNTFHDLYCEGHRKNFKCGKWIIVGPWTKKRHGARGIWSERNFQESDYEKTYISFEKQRLHRTAGRKYFDNDVMSTCVRTGNDVVIAITVPSCMKKLNSIMKRHRSRRWRWVEAV